MRRTALASLVLTALVTLGSPSFAGPTSTEHALAESLFKEGRAFVAAGDFERALPKFVEAHRLDATPGTALNVGNCLEHLGKLAGAWGSYKEAERIARAASDSERQAEAAKRAEALAPKLAKLAIVVPPAAQVSGLEVRRDDGIVGEGQFGSALPVDVGWHEVKASAPGRKTWSTKVRIEANGSSASVDIPVLEVAPVIKGADAAPGTGAGVSSGPWWTPRRTAGVAVGGAGLAGVIAGAIAGGLTLSKVGEAKSHCQAVGASTGCDATGLSLRAGARTTADVSTVALIAGGAAVVGGVVLFATAPSGSAPKPSGALRVRVAVTGAGLAIDGGW